MGTREDIESALPHFTGSETCYRHSLVRRIVFTEGAKYIADEAGAYWLLDEIAIAQMDPKVAAEEFQAWKLTVDLDRHTGLLTLDDGDGRIVLTQRYDHTDFPLPEISLWVENSTIYLPSER